MSEAIMLPYWSFMELCVYMQVLHELNKSRDWAGLHVADNSCFHYRTVSSLYSDLCFTKLFSCPQLATYKHCSLTASKVMKATFLRAPGHCRRGVATLIFVGSLLDS